jgi:hypothetical protein
MELDAYVRALVDADVVRPKEIIVEILRASDAVVDALNAVGPLSFALGDGRAMTWAKVRGNPWDSHDMLTAVSDLSRKFPASTFSITLDPDGDCGTMRDGDVTGIDVAALATWVARHPRPRFAGIELHAELVLEAHAERRAMRDGLASSGLAVEIEDAPGGIVVRVERADHVAAVVSMALRAAQLLDVSWTCKLALSGDLTWRCEVSDLSTGIALECLLTTLLRDVPSQPSAPTAAQKLPPAPELARIGGADQLVLSLDDDSLVALRPDGAFQPTTGTPAHVVPPAAPPFRRYVRGSSGSVLVITEQHLQLGRIQTRIVVLAADGSERTSRVYINPSELALMDDARVVFSAEREGVPELLSIDLATFAETKLLDLAHAPDRLYPQGDAVIALHLGRPNTVKRYPSNEQLTTFDGRAWHIRREGDVVYIVVHHGYGSIGAHDRAALLAIELATGATRTVELGNEHTHRVASNGRWLAWISRGHNVMRVFEALEHRCEIELPEGNVWDVAISPSGAVAYVIGEPDASAILGVAQIELSQPVGVRWPATD